MTERRYEGIATVAPRVIVIQNDGGTRECSRCKKIFPIGPDDAKRDPLARVIWYCSAECAID